MSYTKSLTTDEKIVTSIACMIGVGVFFFPPPSCSSNNFFISSQRSDVHPTKHSSTPVVDSIVPVSDPSPGASTQTVSTVNEDALEDAPHTLALERSLAEKNRVISQLRSQLAAPPLPSESEDEIQAAAGQASVDHTAIIKNLQDAKIQHQVKVNKLNTRISKLQIALDQINTASAQKPQNLAPQSDIPILHQQIAILKDSVSSLRQKNNTLKDEMAQMLAANAKEREREKAPAPPVDPPPTKAATPPPSPSNEKPTFADSAENLKAQEQELFKVLQEIDSLKGDALQEQYRSIKNRFGALSRARVNFLSGKSSVTSGELDKITQVARAAAPTSRFLIVGFADQSGSAAGNRKLSSARAQSVATVLGRTVSGDRIQAIYLGQTGRFGSRANNRVVEIWELPSHSKK